MTVRVRSGVPADPELRPAALRTGRRLRRAFRGDRPVRVTVNDNRRDMVRCTWHSDEVRVSVHWTIAGEADLLARYLARKDISALHALRALNRDRALRRSRGPLRPQGQVHDLAVLLAEVQAACFPHAVPADITWGRRGARPQRARRRTLRLGSRDVSGLVRIHPVLDCASVPAWFVRFVIFHEVLHAVHPPETLPSGRRRVHTRAFRQAERAHPDHDRAQAWKNEHLPRLIQRSGEGLARR